MCKKLGKHRISVLQLWLPTPKVPSATAWAQSKGHCTETVNEAGMYAASKDLRNWGTHKVNPRFLKRLSQKPLTKKLTTPLIHEILRKFKHRAEFHLLIQLHIAWALLYLPCYLRITLSHFYIDVHWRWAIVKNSSSSGMRCLDAVLLNFSNILKECRWRAARPFFFLNASIQFSVAYLVYTTKLLK